MRFKDRVWRRLGELDDFWGLGVVGDLGCVRRAICTEDVGLTGLESMAVKRGLLGVCDMEPAPV